MAAREWQRIKNESFLWASEKYGCQRTHTSRAKQNTFRTVKYCVIVIHNICLGRTKARYSSRHKTSSTQIVVGINFYEMRACFAHLWIFFFNREINAISTKWGRTNSNLRNFQDWRPLQGSFSRKRPKTPNFAVPCSWEMLMARYPCFMIAQKTPVTSRRLKSIGKRILLRILMRL